MPGDDILLMDGDCGLCSNVALFLYPRLKNKSEVFSNVLDGAIRGEFRIENEDEKTNALLNQQI